MLLAQGCRTARRRSSCREPRTSAEDTTAAFVNSSPLTESLTGMFSVWSPAGAMQPCIVHVPCGKQAKGLTAAVGQKPATVLTAESRFSPKPA
jgi:hypothetical protein